MGKGSRWLLPLVRSVNEDSLTTDKIVAIKDFREIATSLVTEKQRDANCPRKGRKRTEGN